MKVVTSAPAGRLLAALGAITLLRLVVAAFAPLAPDEAYYWVWSHALAPGYVDHPGMVALWIRIGTAFAGENAFGIRLLGPISGAIGSVLLWDAVERLVPGRNAGAWAAALLNATLLFGVGTVIMTPDTPLLFFWTAALWALARIGTDRALGWWVLAGVFAGLAMASKYTAVFLWTGVALWLVWVPMLRVHWRRPGPWIGALAGALVFLPVVLWNAEHDWAGFLRQGGRVADWQPSRALTFLGELVGGQFGLATPLIAVLFAAGIVAATRLAWGRRDPAASLLAAVTLPPVAVFLQHALGDRVQGNWPAILYPAMAIAATLCADPFWSRLRRPALALGLAVTLLAYLQATTFALPIPPRRDPIALQLAGWSTLATEVAAAAATTGARFVVADQYALASELAQAMPGGLPVLAVDPRWGLMDLPRATPGAERGLLVRDRRRTDPIGPAWQDPTPAGEASRPGVQDFTLTLVRLGPDLPTVRLPRPTPVRLPRPADAAEPSRPAQVR